MNTPIKVTCFSNNIIGQKWPKFLDNIPNIGDVITSLGGINGKVRKIIIKPKGILIELE